MIVSKSSIMKILLGALLSVSLSSLCFAGSATLSWDKPTTNADGTPLTDFAGHKIYYGTSSGTYSQGIDVGNVTTYTVNNLTEGTTYYFAVTAYNTSGSESPYSNELNKQIPSTTAVNYYCDNDSDGYRDASVDGSCIGTGCIPAGCQSTAGNDCNDTNAGIHPNASDANCNGVDENCSGTADEGYAAASTTCGIGACAATGQRICQNGSVVNTCTPKTPAQTDAVCNGIDDDCNGQVDEDYVTTSTTCGMGVCSAMGQRICQNGTVVNTCAPGNPTGDDSDCDGIDDNCDGSPDNKYVASAISCGTGVCTATGTVQCIGGNEISTCTPGSPSENPETTCSDGLDNDCDGQTDEGCYSSLEAYHVLLTEDFSNGIPATWTAHGNWHTDNTCNRNIGSPFTAPYLIADPACGATGNDELITPAVDTSSCSSVTAVFSNQYNHNISGVELDASLDNGATWMSDEYMVSDSGYPDPEWKFTDLSNVAGAQTAKLRFRYLDNTAGGYWAIDNVWITCQTAQVMFKSDVHVTSPVQTILVTNTGSQNLTINNVKLSGTNKSEFEIASDTCALNTLLPSKSCTIDVSFTPTTAETKSALLSVSSPGVSTMTVPLNGTGIALDPPTPTIKARKKGRRVALSTQVEAGTSYQDINADVWLTRKYRGRTYYYDSSTGKWSRKKTTYTQSSLADSSLSTVITSPKLESGRHSFTYGFDTNMNGKLNRKDYYFDKVNVNIK